MEMKRNEREGEEGLGRLGDPVDQREDILSGRGVQEYDVYPISGEGQPHHPSTKKVNKTKKGTTIHISATTTESLGLTQLCSELKQVVGYGEKRLKETLSHLGWDESVLNEGEEGEKKLSRCSFFPTHLVPPDRLHEHERKCGLRCQGVNAKEYVSQTKTSKQPNSPLVWSFLFRLNNENTQPTQLSNLQGSVRWMYRNSNTVVLCEDSTIEKGHHHVPHLPFSFSFSHLIFPSPLRKHLG